MTLRTVRYDDDAWQLVPKTMARALFECAEALQAVLATLEWQAHGGCRATDGPIMSSADAVAMGKAALAALNGADNA